MVASVWPERLSTPWSCAYSGLMCPGRPNVCGVDSGSARALIVAARSWAETPVVHPSSLSMVTVNGVPSTDVLSSTCLGRSSSSHRLMVIGAHSTPLACFSMKLTASGVIFSAAIIKSPSFSRSSSSTTITNLPSRKSSRADSIVSSLVSVISLQFYGYIQVSDGPRCRCPFPLYVPRGRRWQPSPPSGRAATAT